MCTFHHLHSWASAIFPWKMFSHTHLSLGKYYVQRHQNQSAFPSVRMFRARNPPSGWLKHISIRVYVSHSSRCLQQMHFSLFQVTESSNDFHCSWMQSIPFGILMHASSPPVCVCIADQRTLITHHFAHLVNWRIFAIIIIMQWCFCPSFPFMQEKMCFELLDRNER